MLIAALLLLAVLVILFLVAPTAPTPAQKRPFENRNFAHRGLHTPDKAVNGLQGWIDCFEKASLGGSLFCGGLELHGQAAKSGDALEKAYQFGKSIE